MPRDDAAAEVVALRDTIAANAITAQLHMGDDSET
jgi:hypothetical protein